MAVWGKNKVPRDNADYGEQLKQNRLKEIREEGAAPPGNKKTIIILASIAAAALIAVIIIITLFYDKPKSFMTSGTSSTENDRPVESVEKTLPRESANIHIQRGRESFNKRYFNDAVAEFNEVLESDAHDEDKAIALTYLGMISDERGNYTQAIEYYNRALRYNDKGPEIYKNLALAHRRNKEFSLAVENAVKAISLSGRDVSMRLLLGNIYFEMKRYDDAVKQYGEALKYDPNNASLLFNLGAALLKQGDQLSGMEYFKKAAASDRIGEVAFRSYSRLGVMYIEEQNYDTAEQYLRKAAAIRPRDPVVHYNLGIACLRQNKTKEALAELDKARGLGEHDKAVQENIAEAYFSMKEYDKSLETYQTILADDARNVRILARTGELYYEKGELDRAMEAYRRITKIEPASENARIAYLNMGNILDDTEQYDEAIEAYRKALVINSKDDAVYYNLGIACKHAERPELAIDSWRKASELNENNPRALLALADYYYESKLYDLAEKEYQQILQRWPGQQDAHFKMATIYYKRGENEFALKAYKRVIDINAKNDLARKALINTGILISQTRNDARALAESKTSVQKALLMKPGDPEALLSMGTLHFKEEMYDKAIETFYQVIKSTRDASLIAESYNNIGKSYYQKREYKKSLQAFTRAVEEDPSNEEIRINRKTASQAYEEELAHETD